MDRPSSPSHWQGKVGRNHLDASLFACSAFSSPTRLPSPVAWPLIHFSASESRYALAYAEFSAILNSETAYLPCGGGFMTHASITQCQTRPNRGPGFPRHFSCPRSPLFPRQSPNVLDGKVIEPTKGAHNSMNVRDPSSMALNTKLTNEGFQCYLRS